MFLVMKVFSHDLKRGWRLIRIPVLLSFDLHEMSLNIDMKMIRPVKYSWLYTHF